MAYRITNDLIGAQRIIDTSTVQNFPWGTVVRASDPTYGEGEFIYLKGVASTVLGDVVSYNAYTGVTTRWAGTAGTAAPLAIAMGANILATTFGWYQIAGNAVLTSSGTVAAGDIANYNAAGSVKTAAVAGKQILNCTAASANGVPATNQAVYTIQRPCTQSAIL
jgi:hypothetical protein